MPLSCPGSPHSVHQNTNKLLLLPCRFILVRWNIRWGAGPWAHARSSTARRLMLWPGHFGLSQNSRRAAVVTQQLLAWPVLFNRAETSLARLARRAPARLPHPRPADRPLRTPRPSRPRRRQASLWRNPARGPLHRKATTPRSAAASAGPQSPGSNVAGSQDTSSKPLPGRCTCHGNSAGASAANTRSKRRGDRGHARARASTRARLPAVAAAHLRVETAPWALLGAHGLVSRHKAGQRVARIVLDEVAHGHDEEHLASPPRLLSLPPTPLLFPTKLPKGRECV